MKILTWIILCTALSSCASTVKDAAVPSTPQPEPEAVVEQQQSEVLARKEPGAVKCPKKAKLVKGKCILPVEETE